MKVQHLFEDVLFECSGFVLRLLPLRAVQKVGGAIGEFVGATLGYRRGVALDNLRHGFPEKEEKDIQQIMRGSFRNVGIALFELMLVPRLNASTFKDIIHPANPQIIQNAYAKGKGVVLLTAHFGNWEFIAQSVPVWTGIPVLAIVKSQSNRYIDRQINLSRMKFGNAAVPMENAVRELLNALHEGKAVGIVADQTAAKESIWVPFFGREVPTYEGPAMFCLKTRAPLIMGFPVRGLDGRYSVQFEEVKFDDLKSYTKENILELTKRHVAVTERIIRQYPEQWMWMHKRWKHVAPEAPLNRSPANA
jgi:KDO2-lipid IV(A) lauroyltransferase